MDHLLVSPYFIKAIYYVTTLFGSTAMYVFSLNKGFHGSVDFLRKMFPEHS